MGKYTSGPAWTDVATFLSALDTLHDCRTDLVISVDTLGKSGSLRLRIVSRFPVLPGSRLVREVETSSDWPCPDCVDLEMHVYGGLYRHDHTISQAYQQISIAER